MSLRKMYVAPDLSNGRVMAMEFPIFLVGHVFSYQRDSSGINDTTQFNISLLLSTTPAEGICSDKFVHMVVDGDVVLCFLLIRKVHYNSSELTP